MLFWTYVFFISIFLVFYNYIGYALVVYPFLLIRRKMAKNKTSLQAFTPPVSFIVAVFNEEDCIEEKIQNSLSQDYPKNLIEYIFITDGSTDHSMEIIQRYPSIRLLHQPERKGKSAALNRAVQTASHPILIFSDANAMLNPEATERIARLYQNPLTGGVAGEKKVKKSASDQSGTTNSEGLYWKYESWLKKIDSEFHSVVGAAGELFSLRKELYHPIDDSIILDDFIISMRVAQQGYKVMYEPGAYATELPSMSMEDEQKRKIRIAAGGYQAIGKLSSLFKFWKHPKLFFLYISHRFMRWAVSPLCLVLAFISNLILALNTNLLLFKITLLLQCFLYAAAWIGSFLNPSSPVLKVFKLAHYFVFMNLSVVLGFFRFLKGKQPATWEKAKRVKN